MRAEEHRISFEARLKAIEVARERAAEIRARIGRILSRLGTKEVQDGLSLQDAESAFALHESMGSVAAVVGSIPRPGKVKDLARKAECILEDYWKCVQQEVDEPKRDGHCIAEYDREDFDSLVSSLAELAVAHYREHSISGVEAEATGVR